MVTSPQAGRRDTTIMVWWGDDIPEAMVRLLSHHVIRDASGVMLLPSSMSEHDPMTGQLRTALGSHRIRTRISVPRSPITSIGRTLVPPKLAWRRLALDDITVRVDARLFDGARIGVIPINEAHHHGPFALDLASHFLHPVDRARLLVSRNRARLIAGIAAQTPVDRWVIGTPAGGSTAWLVADDIIATELWALALAERFLDPSLEMQGPWEDATVQRATELDLGVRIPGEMQIQPGDSNGPPDELARLIATCRRRLGMHAPTGTS